MLFFFNFVHIIQPLLYMDLIFLSALLQELLIKNKRVALPGMGTFVLEDISSMFLLDGKTITPPTKKIYFHTSEIKNDGLLENAYAKKKEVSAEEGKDAVALLIKKIRTTLIENMKVDIPGFGSISFGDSYNFCFTIDENFNISPDSYPLELISLKQELGHKEVMEIKTAEKLNDVPEQDAEPVMDIEEEVLITDDSDVSMADVEDNFVFNEIKDIDIEKEIPSFKSYNDIVLGWRNGAKKEEDESVPDMIVDDEIIKDELVEINFVGNDDIINEQVEVNEILEKEEVVVNEGIIENVVIEVDLGSEILSEDKKDKGLRINKWVLIAIILVVSIIIIVALIYVFREELKPLLEKLLYTKQDLQILKQAGEI